MKFLTMTMMRRGERPIVMVLERVERIKMGGGVVVVARVRVRLRGIPPVLGRIRIAREGAVVVVVVVVEGKAVEVQKQTHTQTQLE